MSSISFPIFPPKYHCPNIKDGHFSGAFYSKKSQTKRQLMVSFLWSYEKFVVELIEKAVSSLQVS